MATTLNQHPRYLPPLASSTAACLRWRWQDLDELLDRQLSMIDDEEWANEQMADDVFIIAAEPAGHS